MGKWRRLLRPLCWMVGHWPKRDDTALCCRCGASIEEMLKRESNR